MATPRKPKDQHEKRGPKPMEWTAQQRGEVQGLKMANVPDEEIAKFLNIDVDTLKRYFEDELRRGRMVMVAGAATNIARMALGAKAEYDPKSGKMIRAEVVPELGACCFILKTQGKKFGWSERLEHTGADGAPLFNDLDLGKLSGAEFKTLAKLLGKCGVAIEA